MAGLIVICGPTASGKTALAVHLATVFKTPVLSADSRQVYRGFDIGTAKPTPEERAGVPHYLIDIADPTETYTVAQFQQEANALIHTFHQQGITPILVGGTGLYIQSVTEGLVIPAVAPDPAFREFLGSKSLEELRVELLSKDPETARKIHPHDRLRTSRALEVLYRTGETLSSQKRRNPPSYPIIYLGLDTPDRTFLSRRIELRTQAMLQKGLLDEIQSIEQQYSENLPLLETLGYREFRQYLGQKCSLEEAIEQTILHTRQFAKRQTTWFKVNPNILWLDIAHYNFNQLADEVERSISSWLSP
ncbi:MAG: tRNA (adenosine(37)-N6)-dimethylallyltransferase MiaA [Gloeobacterales cyanobacterium]